MLSSGKQLGKLCEIPVGQCSLGFGDARAKRLSLLRRQLA